VVISKTLEAAIKDYSGLDASLQKSLALEIRSGAGGKADDFSIPAIDYAGSYAVRDAIIHSICNLQIGAESMGVLKKPGSDNGAENGDVQGESGTGARKKKSRSGPSEGKAKSDKPPVSFDCSLTARALQEAVQTGTHLAEMINGARYIDALPGNYLNPENYEQYARELARRTHLKIKVFQTDSLEKMGCNGILSVGRGSAIPPRMILLEHKPEGKLKARKPLVLVGKGITFDTGGISIKPSAEMHEMKFDMCGSALVLHVLGMAARQKWPVHVIGLLGIAENMPDGNAIKPGDVYTAYNGLTVEVQNTDAEGRLVLGDVLSYACEKYDPLCLIDFATLTGACIISLGHEAAGIMSRSEDLVGRLERASRRSLDRVWRLPHWTIYDSGLKSDIADLRNIAGRPAGTITAGRFLSRFVPEHIPWAHVDIAGTAWRSRPNGAQTRGATGWGVRMMHAFIEDLIEGAGRG
ncbi:MAG: leucyl aminopeptidase, partial [Leptospiraceae bacterium]|nr:leucyl aminopeptidase [Leptospiraceae bacterium]